MNTFEIVEKITIECYERQIDITLESDWEMVKSKSIEWLGFLNGFATISTIIDENDEMDKFLKKKYFEYYQEMVIVCDRFKRHKEMLLFVKKRDEYFSYLK